MKKLLLALTIALLPTCAFAGSFPLPAETPVASVAIPDDWKPNVYEGGVEGNSPDGTIYIAAEVVTATDIKSTTEEALKLFIKQGLTIDEGSIKQSDLKAGGMDGAEISMTGKDKTGPADVSIAILAVSAEKFVFITYWGSPEGAKANDAAIGQIVNSIKKQ